MGGIGVLVAIVLMVFSSATLSAMIVAAMTMDWRAFEAFTLLSAAYFLLSAFTYLVSSSRPGIMSRAQVFSGVIVMWLTLVFAAMPPFMMLEGAGPFVAFFEASSAATTLGASLMPVSLMSTAMIVFRTATAWLGGLLTLMLAVYVLGRYAIGGIPNKDLRIVMHGATPTNPRLLRTFFEVAVPYAALTLVCAALLVIVGVNPVHAVLGAFNILSTNGLDAWQTSASIFNNRLAETIMIVFMLVGASSIVWLRLLPTGRVNPFAKHTEARAFVFITIFAIVVGLTLSIGAFPLSRFVADDLFNRTFDIISVLTTTGVSHNVRQGMSIPIIFLIGLALVGGSAYSTAGGLKIFRVRSMFHHSANELKRLVYPSQILPDSVDADKKIFSAAKATWSAFFSTLVLVVLATAVFAGLGHDFVSALSLSVGSFASVGNLVSEHLFSAGGGGVPVLSLAGIGVVGIIGRIELLVILAAFSRNHW